MKVVYIAGKMRGLKNYGFDRFFKAEELLESQGFKVFNPARMDINHNVNPEYFPEDFDWNNEPEGIPISVFVKRDVDALCKCTHIYMLKGWESAMGAKAEKAIAEWLNLEVLYE